MRRLGPEDYRCMPWANGLGMTTEIARRDGEDGAIDWRVSIADVGADGPFSSFPGYDRVIVTIEGEGMILRHGGGRRARLGPLEPYAFDGGADTFCELVDGPIRDFNLITRRATMTGDVEIVRAERRLAAPATLLHCLAGSCRVGAGGDQTFVLAAGETALAEDDDGAEMVRVGAESAIVLAVTLGRRGSRDHQPARASAAQTKNRTR